MAERQVYFATVCSGLVCFDFVCSGPVCFESVCSGPVCFDFVELPVCSAPAELVELPVCSAPAELIEEAVAFPTMGARTAAELAATCSLHNSQAVVPHNPQAVVGMAARQASGRSEPGVPVRFEEARDEAVPCPLSEKVQNCAAVSDLLEAGL
jgi:hypothetical protein